VLKNGKTVHVTREIISKAKNRAQADTSGQMVHSMKDNGKIIRFKVKDFIIGGMDDTITDSGSIIICQDTVYTSIQMEFVMMDNMN